MNFSEDGTKLIVGVFSVVEAFETGGCYVYNGDGTKLLHTLLCEDSFHVPQQYDPCRCMV